MVEAAIPVVTFVDVESDWDATTEVLETSVDTPSEFVEVVEMVEVADTPSVMVEVADTPS